MWYVTGKLLLALLFTLSGYKLYFFCQKKPLRRPRVVFCRLDNWFQPRPQWIWIYSVAYYAAMVFLVLEVPEYTEFVFVLFSFLVLLIVQSCIFLLFPTKTPEIWRESINGQRLSERLLRLVHRFDSSANCFPSMHVSVATLLGLHFADINPALAPLILILPSAISLSALYTKQHSVVDLVPGCLLGLIVFDASYDFWLFL